MGIKNSWKLTFGLTLKYPITDLITIQTDATKEKFLHWVNITSHHIQGMCT